jgi:hypothetical protein
MRFRIIFAEIQILKNLDLQIKSYGCLKILGEVWAGWAYARANEGGLTKCAQKMGQGGGKGGGKGQKKDSQGRGQRPLVAGLRPRANYQSATAGCR